MNPDDAQVSAQETEDESRRVAAGFAVETDKFIHTFTHQDHQNPYPTRFVATNEAAYLQGEFCV
jgi:hypothetical protein